MANELVRYKKPGEDVTGKATATITGKRCLKISGNRTGGGGGGLSTDLANVYQVAPQTTGGAAIFGVAAHDAASGALVGVIRGGIVPITAGGTIAAGAEVEVDTAGRVVTIASGKAIGMCLNGATSGNDAEVALYL